MLRQVGIEATRPEADVFNLGDFCTMGNKFTVKASGRFNRDADDWVKVNRWRSKDKYQSYDVDSIEDYGRANQGRTAKTKSTQSME